MGSNENECDESGRGKSEAKKFSFFMYIEHFLWGY
jgi:hypothetical protein